MDSKTNGQTITLVAFLIGILLGASLNYYFVLAAIPSTTIEAGSGAETVSYVIFTDGTTIWAKNGDTGIISYSGTDASTVIQSAIDSLTSGGKISIKAGTYEIGTSINFENKSIILEGEGAGYTYYDLNKDVTTFVVESGFNDWVINVGTDSDTNYGVQIRNLLIDGKDETAPLGAISLLNTQSAILESIWINDFFGTSPKAIGVLINGTAGYGGYYNILRNIHTRRVTVGIQFETIGAHTIIGGDFDNSRAIETYGLYIKSGGTITVLGGDYHNYENSSAIAIYIEGSDANRFYGVRFEWNYKDVVIDSGGGSGRNQFFGGSTSNTQAGGTAFTDNGNIQSTFRDFYQFVTENSGTTTVANNEDIAHGLADTPNVILLSSGNSTYDSVTLTVSVDWINTNSTHFQTDVYWTNGTAITNDVIYVSWYAEHKP